jgi:hypothetical protein
MQPRQKRILATVSALAVALPIGPAPLRAHDWYSLECCHARDCAPVDNMNWSVPTSEGIRKLIVTSKHGTASVPENFPIRESKDGRMHVCMRPSLYGGMGVICLFMAPGM